MGKVKTIVELKNAKELMQQLDQLKKDSEKAIKYTVSDFRKSAPGWVSMAVRERYALSPQQITGKVRKGSAKSQKKVGSTRVVGETLEDAHILYKGRPLTLSNFNMKPTTPSAKYSLQATIIKGQRKTFGKVKPLTAKQKKNVGRNRGKRGTRNSPRSPIMLMKAGRKRIEGAGTYVARQRRSQDRNDVETIKTLSLPQMVDNHQVRANIDKKIEENLQKRLIHHLKRRGLK